DFVGADQIRPGRYDRDEVIRIARPKLEDVRRLGCRRMLECTPNSLGRIRTCWRGCLMPRASRSGRTPAYMARRTISLFLRLREANRLGSSQDGGLRRRARLDGRVPSRVRSLHDGERATESNAGLTGRGLVSRR